MIVTISEKSKRLVVIDKPFRIEILQWCLAHEVKRKLFHHHVFTILLFIESNIERNFINTNQFKRNIESNSKIPYCTYSNINSQYLSSIRSDLYKISVCPQEAVLLPFLLFNSSVASKTSFPVSRSTSTILADNFGPLFR